MFSHEKHLFLGKALGFDFYCTEILRCWKKIQEILRCMYSGMHVKFCLSRYLKTGILLCILNSILEVGSSYQSISVKCCSSCLTQAILSTLHLLLGRMLSLIGPMLYAAVTDSLNAEVSNSTWKYFRATESYTDT